MADARVETIINYYELADGLVSSGDASSHTPRLDKQYV